MVFWVKEGFTEVIKKVKIYKMKGCATSIMGLCAFVSDSEEGVWLLWKFEIDNLWSWIRVVMIRGKKWEFEIFENEQKSWNLDRERK